MILEVDNIELNFSKKRILNGIYLKGEPGKITSILGSNGCGKSCLLQIIFGSLKPKYKLIRVDNKPILKPMYQTKIIGYLPQDSFTPKHLSLISIFELLGVEWTNFISRFNSFVKYKHVNIGKLSGGERRLVETYLILKGAYKIVLLDEPFSHIAPLHIAEIKSLLEEEKQHKSILITDHMYKHVIDIADDIYLLKDGYTKRITNLEDLEFFKYLSVGSMNT